MCCVALLYAIGLICPTHAATNFSVRFGGSDGDFPTVVVTDGLFTFIAGYTYSTNFPGAQPRSDADPNDADIFVTKLSNDGAIVWSVVIGGSGFDYPAAIDTAPGGGDIYVAGRTGSTNFPTTNALQSAASGGSDAFVFRLNTDDGNLSYSTYLGGSGHDAASAIALITNGMQVVVVGTTSSPDFPAGQTGAPAGIDGFVVGLDLSGTNVTLATALRGSDIDSPSAVAVDRFSNIYVAGSTRSVDFPTTSNAYRAEMSFTHDSEAFVTKVDHSTGSLVYSTFLGIPTSSPVGLAVDEAAGVYVGGTEQSFSTGGLARPRAPGTPVPPPTVHWNFESGFLARLAPSGSQVDYIRRYDTSGRDSIRTVVVDNFQTFVAGTMGQHLFTDYQPAPTLSIRPLSACGEESTHLFAFFRNWNFNFVHVSGLGPSTPHPPGIPVPAALYEDRRRADVLVNGYIQEQLPGRVSPVAGLSFLNTYETRFSSNEVLYLRVDGGPVYGQLTSLSVLSGTNTIATFDGAPRLLALTNLPPALYNLTAVAVDSFGSRGTSCPLSFTVLAAPRNDSFYRATHIDGTAYVTNATNEGASAEPTEPVASSLYYAAPRRSVWWCWTAPVSGSFAVEVTSEKISPQVGIFTGSNLSLLERVASAGPGSNVVSAFKATAGTHYFISVDSAYSGDFLFRLRPGAPPANDDHTNRIAITGSNLTINGNNIDATREVDVSYDYAESPASVWWRWTAPAAGRYLASIMSLTFPATVDVRSVANPGGGLPGFGLYPVSFTAAAGEEFDFRVAGGGGSMGNFSLSVSNLIAPANDNFAAATLITSLPASIPGTALGATIEPNEPGDATASVWYRWTAPSNVTLTAEIGPPYAAAIQIYSGTALSNLTVVADEFGARIVTFPAESGEEYYIRLDDYSSGTAVFTLTLRVARSPENDHFASAAVLNGFPINVIGSNREASLEPGESSYWGENVWYRWIAPSNGHYILSIEGTFQLMVTPYVGTSLATLVRATPADFAPERNFATQLFAAAGTEYYMAVSGFPGAGGQFRLRIRPATPPANDNFADRITISGLTVATNGSVVDASVENEEVFSDSFADKSAWWSWTAPESRKIAFWLSNASDFFGGLRVFSGTTLSGLLPVASDVGFSAVVVDAQAGQTYAVQVAGRTQGTFTLNVAPVVPPPNDHFTNSFTLSGHSAWVTGTGLAATLEPGEGSQRPNQDGSVWWHWTAPISGRITLASQGSIGVYTGTAVGNLTSVAEWRSFPRNSTFVARAGETYHIAVHSSSIEPFDLVLTGPAPPPSPELASMRRLANGSFEFQFDSIMGQTNVIDASTDLINWVPVATNFLDCGVLNVLDPAAAGFPHRFYRLRTP